MTRALICECGECNVCRSRERMRQARIDDPERVRQVDRDRYARDTAGRRAAMDAYAATPEGKAARGRAAQSWAQRNPEKRAAQIAVGNAVRDGRLTKGPCVREGEDCSGKIEAHHPDYAKPLDVVWACTKHHDDLDRE